MSMATQGMKDWFKINWTGVATQLVGASVIATVSLVFLTTVKAQLQGYVTSERWNERCVQIDDRFLKLETFVQEGRIERLKFQVEVIDRLARIETMLQLTQTTKKP